MDRHVSLNKAMADVGVGHYRLLCGMADVVIGHYNKTGGFL